MAEKRGIFSLSEYVDRNIEGKTDTFDDDIWVYPTTKSPHKYGDESIASIIYPKIEKTLSGNLAVPISNSDTIKIVLGLSGDSTVEPAAGAAIIMDESGTNQTLITASDAVTFDRFGDSVAVGSNKIAIGAPADEVEGSGVVDHGSVYLYNLDGTGEIKITPSDYVSVGNYARFGDSVAIGNGKLYVGAPGNSSSGTNPGAVYIYDLDGTNEIKVTASDGAAGDGFGGNVVATNNKLAVSASFDDSNRGSVYLYNATGGSQIKVTASDGVAGDFFGGEIDIGSGTNNDKLVVCAEGFNDDQGKVYVYDLSGNNEVIITPSDAVKNQRFARVAASDSKVIVGSYFDSTDGFNNGALYIYNYDGSGEFKLTPKRIFPKIEGNEYIEGIQNLTTNQHNFSFGASISAVGNKIFFVTSRNHEEGESSGALYEFDLNNPDLYVSQNPPRENNTLSDAEERKIFGSDTVSGNLFGDQIVAGGNKILVKAFYKNGNTRPGTLYAFNPDGTGEVKINPSFAEVTDLWGVPGAIGIGTNKIVVGTYDADYNSLNNNGVVHMYNLNGTGETLLTSGSAGDYCGKAIAIGDDRILVGIPYSGTLSYNAGKARLYHTDGTLIRTLYPPSSGRNLTGSHVAIGSGKIVLGPGRDFFDTGTSTYVYDLDGNYEWSALNQKVDAIAIGDNRIVLGVPTQGSLNSNRGRIYIYDLDGNAIANSDQGTETDALLGSDVAVGEGIIAATEPGRGDSATGKGSVHIFDLDGNLLTQIFPPRYVSTIGSDAFVFGTSVEIAHGRLYIAAEREDTQGTDCGAIYVYDMDTFNLVYDNDTPLI